MGGLPRVLLSYTRETVALTGVELVKMPSGAREYAHDLYKVLRDVDRKGVNEILIEAVPLDSEWDCG